MSIIARSKLGTGRINDLGPACQQAARLAFLSREDLIAQVSRVYKVTVR